MNRSATNDSSSALPDTDVAGEAIFSGCLARVPAHRSTLESILPPRVALPQSHSANHPCVLLFGEQADGATYFGGVPMRWGVRYHELMFAVPFVRCEGFASSCLFVSAMACDFWPAVWNGNVYYAFQKQLSDMRWEGDCFSVSSHQGSTSLVATCRRITGTADDALAWMRAVSALPVLGAHDDGSVVRSRFEWTFSEATVEHADVRVNITDMVRGMTPGQHQTADALLVSGMKWRLSWPSPVSR
jgi:hypothetical protein